MQFYKTGIEQTGGRRLGSSHMGISTQDTGKGDENVSKANSRYLLSCFSYRCQSVGSCREVMWWYHCP